MRRRARKYKRPLDFTSMTSVPVRDMERDGVTARDLCIVPGGGRPAMRAVERMGLDPHRYQAWIWDLLVPAGGKS